MSDQQVAVLKTHKKTCFTSSLDSNRVSPSFCGSTLRSQQTEYGGHIMDVKKRKLFNSDFKMQVLRVQFTKNLNLLNASDADCVFSVPRLAFFRALATFQDFVFLRFIIFRRPLYFG